ncbi:MAG: hypothetical protein AAGB27_00725 [Pseudomonadota bacterium]
MIRGPLQQLRLTAADGPVWRSDVSRPALPAIDLQRRQALLLTG